MSEFKFYNVGFMKAVLIVYIKRHYPGSFDNYQDTNNCTEKYDNSQYCPNRKTFLDLFCRDLSLEKMYLLLILTSIITLKICASEYEYRCPIAHGWRIRAKALCKGTAKYSCLHDENKYTFREICREMPSLLAKGNKYVIRGNLDGEACNENRYQPFIFETNQNSECVLKKSSCSEEGQTVYSNGSTTADKSFRCDFSKSYAPIEKPNHPCYCVPLEEDCSCYLKICPDKTHLSSEFTCVSDYSLLKPDVCGPITLSRLPIPGKSNIPNTNSNLQKDITYGKEKDILSHIFRNIACALILTTIGCVVLIFLFIFDKKIESEGVKDNADERERPEIETANISYSIEAGKEANLHTVVNGRLTKLSWEKMTENDMITIDVKHNRRYKGGTIVCPTLTIKHVDPSDQGHYTCFAINDYGTAQSNTISLSVSEKVDHQKQMPKHRLTNRNHHIRKKDVFHEERVDQQKKLSKHRLTIKNQDSKKKKEFHGDALDVSRDTKGYRTNAVNRNTPEKKVVDTTCLKAAQKRVPYTKEIIEQLLKMELQTKEYLEKELRIVLIGKIGVGKSATANTIIGRKLFVSSMGAAAITQTCIQQYTKIQGKDVLVVDTPGIYDTDKKPRDIKNEILKCIQQTSPGPHAVLFVMKLTDRYKQEDYDAFTVFLSYFGMHMLQYGIVVFTHSDILKQTGKSFECFIDESPSKLKELIDLFGKRTICFDNTLENENNVFQINSLIEKIEALKASNYKSYYNDANYQRIECELKEMEEKHYVEKQNLEAKIRQCESKNETLRLLLRDNSQSFETELEMPHEGADTKLPKPFSRDDCWSSTDTDEEYEWDGTMY